MDLAANGAVAIEMLQRQQYDVVLMDVQMPVMDGIEAGDGANPQGPKERRPAHYRNDRQRHAKRPEEVPGCRNERPCRQAD